MDFVDRKSKIKYLFEKFNEIKSFTQEKYQSIDEINNKDPLISPNPNIINLKDLVSVIKE